MRLAYVSGIQQIDIKILAERKNFSSVIIHFFPRFPTSISLPRKFISRKLLSLALLKFLVWLCVVHAHGNRASPIKIRMDFIESLITIVFS